MARRGNIAMCPRVGNGWARPTEAADQPEHEAPASESAWARSLALRVLMSFRSERFQGSAVQALGSTGAEEGHKRIDVVEIDGAVAVAVGVENIAVRVGSLVIRRV